MHLFLYVLKSGVAMNPRGTKLGRPPKPQRIVQIRLDLDLFERIEAWRAKIERKEGAAPTFTAAVERLVRKGLK